MQLICLKPTSGLDARPEDAYQIHGYLNPLSNTDMKKKILNKWKITFNLMFYQRVSCKHWQCYPLRQDRSCIAELFRCRVQTLQGILNIQSLNCLLHGQELSFIRDDTAFTLSPVHSGLLIPSLHLFLLCVESKLPHLICTVVTEHSHWQTAYVFIPITSQLIVTGDPMNDGIERRKRAMYSYSASHCSSPPR